MVNRCRHEWCIRLYRFSNFSDCYYHGYFYWFKWIFNEFRSDFSPNNTFKLIVYSLLAAAFTYLLMILYTGWLSSSETSLNGQLWLTGAVTSGAFGYIGLAILAIAIIMGIFTGLNGFLMS